MKPIAIAACSAIVSITLVLACSDDSPGTADAATCDCPASEAPITNTRVVRVDGPDVNVDGAGAFAGAVCPANAIVLTGGCYVTEEGTGTGALLSSAGPGPVMVSSPATGWQCTYSRNNTGSIVTVHAQVTCLLPAP